MSGHTIISYGIYLFCSYFITYSSSLDAMMLDFGGWRIGGNPILGRVVGSFGTPTVELGSTIGKVGWTGTLAVCLTGSIDGS